MDAIDRLNFELGIGPRRPQLPRELIARGYTAIKLVGKGSFGSANLVFNERTSRYSIAKEVILSSMTAKQRADAQNEISILSSLSHPNIIRYEECFVDEERVIVIIMEYADGGDLESRVRAKAAMGTPFRPPEAARIFGQVCLALKYLHDRRILHRDLKSQNVFLTKTNVAKLGDFGISTVLQNSVMMARTICGTPYYFSPELCRGHAYNNKSDIWALGCLLYEVLALDVPFKARDMNGLMRRILDDPVPSLPRGVDPRWQPLVEQLLAKDAAQRPEIAGVLRSSLLRELFGRLAADFEQAATQQELAVRDAPPPGPSARAAAAAAAPPPDSGGSAPQYGRRAGAAAEGMTPRDEGPTHGRRSSPPPPPTGEPRRLSDGGRHRSRGEAAHGPPVTQERCASGAAPRPQPQPQPVSRREVPAALLRSTVPERAQRVAGDAAQRQPHSARRSGDWAAAAADDDPQRLLDNLDAMIGAASRQYRSATPPPACGTPPGEAHADCSMNSAGSSMPEQPADTARAAEEFRSVADLFRQTAAGQLGSSSGSGSTGGHAAKVSDDAMLSGPPPGEDSWCDGWASGVDLTRAAEALSPGAGTVGRGAPDTVDVVVAGDTFSLRQSHGPRRVTGVEALLQEPPLSARSANDLMSNATRDDWRYAAQQARCEELTRELEAERAEATALRRQVEDARGELAEARRGAAATRELEKEDRAAVAALRQQVDELRAEALAGRRAAAPSRELEAERQRGERLQRQVDELRAKLLSLTEENLALRRQVPPAMR
eukprot:TRINITY_DN7836_c1_g2_i1.p1 TRINITY_DN7836_c1_g2~~TRINITY_DN7836_c1_g2_i1.p1  ORF type:complete len:818 (+),score=274.53 TRINITY_DN7836_c1_g2_i1:127-2454(+)